MCPSHPESRCASMSLVRPMCLLPFLHSVCATRVVVSFVPAALEVCLQSEASLGSLAVVLLPAEAQAAHVDVQQIRADRHLGQERNQHEHDVLEKKMKPREHTHAHTHEQFTTNE